MLIQYDIDTKLRMYLEYPFSKDPRGTHVDSARLRAMRETHKLPDEIKNRGPLRSAEYSLDKPEPLIARFSSSLDRDSFNVILDLYWLGHRMRAIMLENSNDVGFTPSAMLFCDNNPESLALMMEFKLKYG